MSEFSVNTDRIESLSDMLERQAKALEDASGSIDSVRRRLSIQGSAKTQILSAMKTLSTQVKEEREAAVQMGKSLREIAAAYRTAENSILGISMRGGRGPRGSGSGSGTQNGNNKGSGFFSPDPVNLNTGNFILDNCDMTIPGFQMLALRRFYNSRSKFGGLLGRNWNFNFEVKLLLTPDVRMGGADVCIMLSDGREEYFAVADGKKYRAVSGTTSELVRRDDIYVYKTLDNEYYHFDRDGKYVRYENAHHVGYNLTYENSILKRVEKDSGEFFAFIYDAEKRLAMVQDHTGRCCKYEFEGEHLKKVFMPDGAAYQYDYDDSGSICRVLNPRNIGAVETKYDDSHRVVYQKFADGTMNLFEYRDAEQAVVMTERNGSKSIHYHDDQYRNICNVYADGQESFEYNDRGQKTVITDKLGHVVRLQYDDRGNVTTVLTEDKTKICATYNQQNCLLTMSVNGKSKVRNQYNAFGDLISTEDGLGRKIVYTYDDCGRMIKAGMPDQEVIAAGYDERGNLCTVKKANGAVTRFEYDALNQIVLQINPLGRTNAYEYDLAGRVISETREDGKSKYYQYDEWGNVVLVKDFDGSITTGTYNENNKPASVTDAGGRKICFEYDSMWNMKKTILPNGGVFHYMYDENNRLETVRDAEGNETHYRYDALGNVLAKIDAEGAETGYEWDACGRCQKVTAPDGTVTEYRYDPEDHIIYIKDAEGNERFRSFDEAGQLVNEKDSHGRQRSYSYDEAGNLTSVLDEKGQETLYEYAKGLNKITKILYPDGTKEEYSYDLNGNLQSYTDIYGVVLRCRYDELERLVSVTGDQGSIVKYTYDLLGRVTAKEDAEGQVTRYEYSPTGQLTAVTDAAGNVTCYSYDEMDELVQVLRKIPGTDEQMRISYERDLMSRITKLTDALGEEEIYQYNSLGRMIEKTDRDHQRTSYRYNNLGLLETVRWADGKEVSYEYSPLRRLSAVHDWTGDTRIEYDDMGNMTQITYPDQRTLKYEYDSRGNRTEACYPGMDTVKYEYDSKNRLEKIIQDGAFLVYQYNDKGQVSSRKMSNGSDIQYRYDGKGALSRMTYSDAEGILDDFTYEYDRLGRRRKYGLYRRDYPQDNGIYDYVYDPAGHIEKVIKDSRLLRSYIYDELGNRTGMTEYNPQTQLTEQTAYKYDLRGGILEEEKPGILKEYKYDQRGNLIQVFHNGQIQNRYQYDAMNRLTASYNQKGETAEYQYNGLGYRVGTRFVCGGLEKTEKYTLDYSRIYDNLIEKRENQKTEAYIWGNKLEGFMTERGENGWYLTDSQGSVLRKMDRHTSLYIDNYDEFGNSLRKCRGEEETFGYNGFLFDPIAGTYFAQARQYRCQTGTFDAMDRLGGDITMADTWNPYIYCIHDPLNHTDKSAYWFGFDDAIAAVIGAAGGAGGKFIGDLINGLVSGKWKMSSWQEYIGATIGGAAGGVASLYAGPIGGGAVAGGTTTLVTEGLTWISDPDSYNKSLSDVAKEAAIDTGMGALSGAVSKMTGELMKKLANTGIVQKLIAKMNGGGKFFNMIADYIDDIAHGRSGKSWSQMEKILKNQHNAIANSEELKNKLFSVMIHGLRPYIIQEVWGKFTDKLKPSKILWDKIKKHLSDGAKKWIGIGAPTLICAAAGGGAGGGGGAFGGSDGGGGGR